MSRVLCCGDVHMGAGTEYGNVPGERLAEQEAVWDRIVDVAIDQDVDAFLFAGDAVERRRPTPSEILAFVRPLRRLKDTRIDVLAVAGNHDVEAFDRPTALELFDGLLDVHREPGIWQGRGVTVCTLPWTPVANLVARSGGGDRDEINVRAAELLLDTARDLRAQCQDIGPKILLLHWSVSGASLPSGLPVDDLREPVIPMQELDQLGFDAVVCGHIHKAQVLVAREENGSHAAAAFYVGSPMPLNFGEASVDHGVWILDTESWVPEFVPIESRKFVTLDVDVEGLEEWINHSHDPEDAIGITNIDGAIVKVRYKATAEQARRIDHAKIREALLDAGAHKVFAIEASIERASRVRVEGVDESIDETHAMDLWIAEQYRDAAQPTSLQLDRLRERHGRFVEEVRP